MSFVKVFGLSLFFVASAHVSSAQSNGVFHSLYKGVVTSKSERIPFSHLVKNHQIAQISLNHNIDGADKAVVLAWGEKDVLVEIGQVIQILSLKELEQSYSGASLTPDTPKPALFVGNSAQTSLITSLGDDAEITASYTIYNNGQLPLNLSIASTSCGCTVAELEKQHLDVGESTILRAKMHADSDRLVYITLVTDQVGQPITFIGLQSKQTFGAFKRPSPLSLVGVKGQRNVATTAFELPKGWKVSHIRASPDWLETQLKEQAGSLIVNGKIPTSSQLLLSVAVPQSAPEGALKGRVRVELEGGPLKHVSIPVTGFVSSDITVSPSLVFLDNIGRGTARRIVIVHGPKPFSIIGYHSDAPSLEIIADSRVTAKAHAVELRIPIKDEIGTSFLYRVTMELSDGRELPIDVSGKVSEKELPELAQGIRLSAPAPVFSGVDVQHKKVSLVDFKGRSNVLLTFFPHCFTGGCESHLASLREVQGALTTANTRVVAVSTDDAAQVRAFAKQLHLPFSVISDSKRQICLAYGVVQGTTDYPSRLSVLIDKSGKVRWIDEDVHVLTHGADVINKIHELGLDR